jgi:hypothetical protein
MNTQDIQRFLPADITIPYAQTSRFSKSGKRKLRFAVYSLDQLLEFIRKRVSSPQEKVCDCIIFNCCPSTEPGKHWLVLILDDTKELCWQFFDPLAQDVFCYSRTLWLVLQPFHRVWRNEKRVQSPLSVQCGEHCLLFIYGYKKYRVITGEFAVYRIYNHLTQRECEERARTFRIKLEEIH